MNPGYVYILLNHSMPGILKVGKTRRDPRARARELSTTSVPTPYVVAFELFSDDYDDLEKKMHLALSDFRVSPNREFFKYPLNDAIALLIEYNQPSEDAESIYFAEDIFERLKEKYGSYLDPNIVSVRIVQTHNHVWLEITWEELVGGYLKDQIIKRSDLAFIRESEKELVFSSNVAVTINARKFTEEYDIFSIIMTTDLFHEEACKKIDREHNPIYKEKSQSGSRG